MRAFEFTNEEILDEINWKKALATGALAGAATIGAMNPAQARISIGPDGQPTPSLAQQLQKSQDYKPGDEKSMSTELPGKDLPSADKVDRDGKDMTVSYDGKDYKAIMLDPDGPQPRLGPGTVKIKIPMAMMGYRGIGNYIGMISGDRIYIKK